MPTTLLSAVLFLLFSLPGICYVARLERSDRPAQSTTVSLFRETATVILSGTVFLALAALLFAAARAIWPGRTFDLGAVIRDSQGRYIRAHYVSIAYWSALFLSVAMALATMAAALDLARRARAIWPFGSAAASDEGSGWWVAFQDAEAKGQQRHSYIFFALVDGTRGDGSVGRYNDSSDETVDRSLTINAPLHLKEPGQPEVRVDVGSLILSADQLRWLRIEYLDPSELQAAETRTLLSA